MKVRWLGWAGVEIESGGACVVVDPLADAAATFAPLGELAARARLPEVLEPTGRGCAVAGLISHLHRDHADATALAGALAPEATVYEPPGFGGAVEENLALAQAEQELSAAGLAREPVEVWGRRESASFTFTALPAVDGLGDPQVAWAIEADGARVLHLGDTLFHGYWWRIARRLGPFDVVLAPINGAVISFPHLRPPSPLAATLEPEQAVLVAQLLGATTLVPIHYDGYAAAGVYEPVANARERLLQSAALEGVGVRVLEPGEDLVL